MLKIVITHKWCHPEFGGTRTETWEYPMSEATSASEKFYEMKGKIQDVYSHISIKIVEFMSFK